VSGAGEAGLQAGLVARAGEWAAVVMLVWPLVRAATPFSQSPRGKVC